MSWICNTVTISRKKEKIYVIRVSVASLSAVLAAPNVELKMELEQMEASLLQLTARVLAQLAPLLQLITIFFF
jgi:hypothetical protein